MQHCGGPLGGDGSPTGCPRLHCPAQTGRRAGRVRATHPRHQESVERGMRVTVICSVCRHHNAKAAPVCAQCGLPMHGAAPAAAPLEPLDFQFDGVPARAHSPSRRSSIAKVGLIAGVLAVAGAAAWFFWQAQPDAAPSPAPVYPATPAAVPVPSTDAAVNPASSATPPPEPLEEIIESRRDQARNAAADADPSSAPAASAAAPAALPPFTPVTVPRVPDAAPQPVPARPPAPPGTGAPWPPVPASPGESLARLRGALAQCEAMGNELSRNSCLARTRQNLCGSAWGRIPECPPGQ